MAADCVGAIRFGLDADGVGHAAASGELDCANDDAIPHADDASAASHVDVKPTGSPHQYTLSGGASCNATAGDGDFYCYADACKRDSHSDANPVRNMGRHRDPIRGCDGCDCDDRGCNTGWRIAG